MSEDGSVNSAGKLLDSKYLSGVLDHIRDAQDHLAGNDGTPLSPSFLPPNAIWTSKEKNTFFHALSVHSRFRPDLISHEIKTKSVPDVCNYLSVLRSAASQRENTVPCSQWRQNLPIATEVSPEWVAMEEETAIDVIAREQDWQRELVTEQRRAELKLLKKASKSESHDMEPSRRKAELQQKIADANLRDRRKDFCGSLGSLELTAIGAILREATDSSDLGRIERLSVLRTRAPQNSPKHIAEREPSQTLPFSAIKVANAGNPLDLAQRSNGNGGPLSPNAAEPPSPKQDSTRLVEGLSPISRRRYQKRLYMRRKRASMSGATTVDDSLECLKPGRKKARRSSSPEYETLRDLELPASLVRDAKVKEDAISVSGTDESSVPQKRYPRAKQMAIKEFRDLGLNAGDLGRLGVDVVNPEGVAKMLNLWDKLSGDTFGHSSRISLETIQLLNVHVIWFVKNLIFRAITLREQERDLKSETKVWKLSGKPVLTRDHVERAVSMANSRELNKAGFFEGIITEMNVNVGAGGAEGGFSESGPDVTLPPLHRDIYAPLVWIPEVEGDSEMTDNTDDEEVDNELLEEEGLDELDMDIEMEHESWLWDKAQKSRSSDPSNEAPVTKGGQRTAYKSAEFVEDSD